MLVPWLNCPSAPLQRAQHEDLQPVINVQVNKRASYRRQHILNFGANPSGKTDRHLHQNAVIRHRLLKRSVKKIPQQPHTSKITESLHGVPLTPDAMQVRRTALDADGCQSSLRDTAAADSD